ncbi:MAG: hypothetical protein RMY33_031630 [Nostoc sp. DedQUE03]|nr:hypothetical protein [Nostoc sp. DedQUE02]
MIHAPSSCDECTITTSYSAKLTESLISRSYTLQEINQALADVEKGSVLKAVIVPNLS